jgi:glutamyl-tRNA reductase
MRERAAICCCGKLADSLSLLRPHMPEAVVLSTCNRTEIYTVTHGDDCQRATAEFLRTMLDAADGDFFRYVYHLRGMDAARHLFRVASGLESMIVGECEILGQIKQALETAEKAGMASLPLRQTFQGAIRTGRLVREQTGISRNPLSASSVAVELAAGVIGDLKECRMLVIGAGDAGRLVARAARDRGASQIAVANRTKDRAQALASLLNGLPTDLSDLDNQLRQANIVVACAAAPHPILSFCRVEAAMAGRPNVPLVIIDIAMPRNVEPEVSNIPNVRLHNLDDLTGLAHVNRKQREGEIQHAEQIVAEEVEKFGCWWHDLEIRPLIGALMSRAESIRVTQLNKTLRRLPPLSAHDLEHLEALTKSIVTQILKEPVQYLKETGSNGHAEFVKELFRLKAKRAA